MTIESQDGEHIFDGILTDAIADVSATIPWDATYAANDTGVPSGAYVVIASAYDAAGNAAQVNRTIIATTTYHACRSDAVDGGTVADATRYLNAIEPLIVNGMVSDVGWRRESSTTRGHA